MTDLTLYWLIPKDRSSRVRWLLRELDVEFSEKKMNASAGEHRSGDYLDVNPFGKVPAIVTDDLTLSESGAILLYLLEVFDNKHHFSPKRDTGPWPTFLQWFFWGLTTFEGSRNVGRIRYIRCLGFRLKGVYEFVAPQNE